MAKVAGKVDWQESATQWKFAPDRRRLEVVVSETVTVDGTDPFGETVVERWEKSFSQSEDYSPLPGGGCTVRAAVSHSEARRNGELIDDRLGQALMGHGMLLRLDPTGKVEEVEGISEALADIEAELGPGGLDGGGRSVSVERMAERAGQEFSSRYDGLLGRPFGQGTWIVRGAVVGSPVGVDVRVLNAATLDGFEEIGGRRCGIVRVVHGCVPADFREPAARQSAVAYFEAAKIKPKLPSTGLTGTTRYWFELDTGLLRRADRRLDGVSRRATGGRTEDIRFRMEQSLSARDLSLGE